MILIVGGACQGKRSFALRLYEENYGRPAECSDVPDFEAVMKRPVVNRLEEYIREFAKEESAKAAREKTEAFLRRLLKENPEAIVICRELGCGIVPIDPADRLWRDLSGEACQFLAGHSREVYRVICGIPMKLKGEDK